MLQPVAVNSHFEQILIAYDDFIPNYYIGTHILITDIRIWSG